METNNNKETLFLSLFLPGPEFDPSGCQRFHFMPRFVRFLPGETLLNNLCCFPSLFVSLWWSVLTQVKTKEKASPVLSPLLQTFLHTLL